jgi:acyl-coenzyme A thioesterase PaaI-like protein
MQSQFLRGAKPGDVVEVLPVVTRQTRSIIFIRGDFQVDGETVYSCASLWKILGRD